jgi:hypothetical protein
MIVKGVGIFEKRWRSPSIVHFLLDLGNKCHPPPNEREREQKEKQVFPDMITS